MYNIIIMIIIMIISKNIEIDSYHNFVSEYITLNNKIF